MLSIRRSAEAIRAKEAADLEAAKASAKSKVATWAATERAKYMTVMPGQEMIYLAKEAEAYGYLTDPTPRPENYPFIAAEIGITAPDGYQIAQIWAHMSALWRDVAAQIEAVRLGLAAEIDAAGTAAEIETALDRLLPRGAAN